MRSYMRDINLGRDPDESIPAAVGMTGEQMYDMYRLLALAKYDERYVIPPAHAEQAHGLEELATDCPVSDYVGREHRRQQPVVAQPRLRRRRLGRPPRRRTAAGPGGAPPSRSRVANPFSTSRSRCLRTVLSCRFIRSASSRTPIGPPASRRVSSTATRLMEARTRCARTSGMGGGRPFGSGRRGPARTPTVTCPIRVERRSRTLVSRDLGRQLIALRVSFSTRIVC